jgi:hypothetical protein
MLELGGGGGGVVTVDIVHPKDAGWAGLAHRPVIDPTSHPLWAKYVTFIKARGCGAGYRSDALATRPNLKFGAVGSGRAWGIGTQTGSRKAVGAGFCASPRLRPRVSPHTDGATCSAVLLRVRMQPHIHMHAHAQGSDTDREVMEQLVARAAKARRVLVLLDSAHTDFHVAVRLW